MCWNVSLHKEKLDAKEQVLYALIWCEKNMKTHTNDHKGLNKQG